MSVRRIKTPIQASYNPPIVPAVANSIRPTTSVSPGTAMPPAEAPASTNGENVGPALLIVVWALFPISAIVVGLRFTTKLVFARRKLQLDDALIFIALLVQLIFSVITTIDVRWGLGRHMSDLSDVQRLETVKWIVLNEPFAVLGSMFGRIAFAVYLLYMLGTIDSVRRLVLQVVIVLQITFNLLVVVQLLAQCGKDVSAQWDPVVAATAHCQSPLIETRIGYVQSSVNSLCDLILTIVPLLVVKQLHLSMRTKVGLIGLLCLSCFAFVASLIKAVSIKNLSVRNNFSYNIAFLSICCAIENNLVMIGASIPTLKPLLKVVTGQSTSHSNGDRNTGAKTCSEFFAGGPQRSEQTSQQYLRNDVDTDGNNPKSDVTIVMEHYQESV